MTKTERDDVGVGTGEIPMPLETQDMALFIEALARRDADPLTRFVRSLSNDPPMRARTFAEETIRLRDELISNVQRMLTETNPQRSALHAEWVARHAHEVAYRWSSLMRTVERWSMYDTGPAIRVVRGPA